jgi:hypothetical protein
MYHECMTGKRRLSATVDAELVEASQAAVAAGRAESVSAWVNDALRLKVELDRRLRALDDFIASYEADHGEITDDEMTAAVRRARERAIVVRSDPGDAHGRGAA